LQVKEFSVDKMMQNSMRDREIYSIEKVSDTTAVVFANSYVNPISFLPYIEEQLASMSFSGEVIFDLLLSNGHTFNRIVASSVVQGKVDRKAFKIVDLSSLGKVVAQKIKAFYKSNDVLVQSNFILSDEEKEFLLR
jgi:hypothetical protein